ncbi:CDK5 regulatory subunit-associated protein 3 isoform X3 [Myxocyprinus asiaticus]|uniref:CDK5 regulatory subunit-associated protein 3 isoform X3 n=1 Tax=Myxocyprinus asiaticus TaxID=70543 RepID=UPI0022226274|nr:CDK5 regulatory subunit-associated protein 3 isoform X3 [Myxocyprinus asiaticus]
MYVFIFRQQDWQEIVSIYENDNVYLAEVVSLLFRSVSYEGPALRKQVSKAQQLQQELSRREQECQSGAADTRECFYMACKQYDIKQLSEMSEEGDMVAMSQFQLAPSVIQAQTPKCMQVMLAEVRGLLNRLTILRMQHLFMIQASPWYVERVSELLWQKLKQADILVLKHGTLSEKRQEFLEEQAKLEPRICWLLAPRNSRNCGQMLRGNGQGKTQTAVAHKAEVAKTTGPAPLLL